jgi:hypothetical protein
MGRYEDRKWSGQKGKKFGHAGRTEDPYQPAEGQEAAMCSTCQALYQNKRWLFDEKLAKKVAGTDKVKMVTCPTCRKIKDHYPEGHPYLERGISPGAQRRDPHPPEK